ncbi:MAG TPA: RNA polymerase sigma factor [Polyangia bacterium]|nr:RNA polymerase sigma factor [Polyangia bacterium]
MIDSYLKTIWNFCSRMTLSSQEAREVTFETFERAAQSGHPPADAKELELWLLKIAAHVIEKRLPAKPEVDFDLLDETLRSDATRTHEVSSLTTPEREFLLWELKQGCMTAVINCLSPGERVAFVLSSVMSKSDDDAAKALGIKVSAFKVRLSRARKKIGDYLAPRCEHVDPRNPCHCPSRIGIALAKGFIAPPQTSVVQLRAPQRPFNQEIKSRDSNRIFQTLPEPEVPAELVEQLRQAAATGAWTPKAVAKK